MKKSYAIALVTLASLATTAGLCAQTPALKADIPFNFIVGETTLPAGVYTVSLPDWHVMSIRSSDHHILQLVSSSQSNHEASSKRSELVFDKLGSYYFLHRVLSPQNSSLNNDIPVGKIEKRMRRQEARLAKVDETLIATR